MTDELKFALHADHLRTAATRTIENTNKAVANFTKRLTAYMAVAAICRFVVTLSICSNSGPLQACIMTSSP